MVSVQSRGRPDERRDSEMTIMDLVILARTTPVEATRFRHGVGQAHHAEYLSDSIKSALFASQSHRTGTRLHIVLEAGTGIPRTLTFDGDVIGDLGELTETGIIRSLADALDQTTNLVQGESVALSTGIIVSVLAFEPALRALGDPSGLIGGAGKEGVKDRPRFLLQPDGTDIRELDTAAGGVFVMSDHVPMPRKIAKSLIRRGYAPLSVGPRMLQTAHCITLIHNEFDRSPLR